MFDVYIKYKWTTSEIYFDFKQRFRKSYSATIDFIICKFYIYRCKDDK